MEALGGESFATGDLLAPAPDLIPAVEAVAMMLPPE